MTTRPERPSSQLPELDEARGKRTGARDSTRRAEDAKSAARRQFGSHAEAYVRSRTHASGDDLARMVELASPEPEDDVLDIATGGGHVAAALAPHVRSVIAADLTPAMLEAAANFFRERRLSNVKTLETDAEALQLRDGMFDTVTCRIAPHHFPRPDRFVDESARVLRPGGRFLLIDTTVAPGPVGDWHNDFEKARDPSHVRSLTVAEWSELIANAGLILEVIEHFPKRHTFHDWTARAGLDAPARGALGERLLKAPTEVREALSVQARDGQVVSFTDQKTLFSAIKPG